MFGNAALRASHLPPAVAMSRRGNLPSAVHGIRSARN
jgi:hypothetical protein